MFTCEKYRCTMEERHCLGYQEAARASGDATINLGDNVKGYVIDRSHCLDCPQGRAMVNNEGVMARSICTVEGCGKVVVAQGLCNTHYDKWRRNEPAMVAHKGGEYTKIRLAEAPARAKGDTTGPKRETMHVPTVPGVRSVSVPVFEARVLAMLADRAGETTEACFLRCLRVGLEAELARW